MNPRTAQESSLFEKAINTLYVKNLKSKAQNKALNSIGDRLQKQVNASFATKANNANVSNLSGQLYNQAKKATALINKAANNSKAKISKNADVANRVKQIAKNRALAKTDFAIESLGEAESYYARALIASKMQIGLQTAGNMASQYFVDPFMQEQYLTGVARVGAALGITGGVVGVGVIGSNILSGSYHNNYYDNLNSQDNNGIQNY